MSLTVIPFHYYETAKKEYDNENGNDNENDNDNDLNLYEIIRIMAKN